MEKKGTVFAVAVAASFLASAFAVAEAVQATGRIESVTLYRGQALVTRVVSIDAPAGPTQIVVGELPEQIVGESLYAAGRGDLQVRAVRYHTRALEDAPREEVRKLDDEIEELEKEMRKVDELQKTLKSHTAYLSKLENFVAPTAQMELSKGVLNAETLVEMTTFIAEQRDKHGEQTFGLKEQQRELKKQLDLTGRKRSELTRSGSRVEREALIFVEKAQAGATELSVSYMVRNATWTPAYNLRGAGTAEGVAVEYNALVNQMSGEDWTGVDLTLSTALPTMGADPLVLAPMLITLRPAGQNGQRAEQFKEQYSSVQGKIRDFQGNLQALRDRTGQIARNWGINTISNDLQELELNVSEANKGVLYDLQRSQSLGLSAEYRLPGKTSVASRSDQQVARIANLILPARFSNVAMPLLTQEVYRQAELTNNSNTALLGGQSSVYLDGEFVGSGTIPVVACGQKFLIGFGPDPQLRARREFMSREDGIRSWLKGGNREVASKYRLVFDNYKDDAVKLHVFERVPYAIEDIKLTLGKMSDPLSEEKEYVRSRKPYGILRWDIEVPAHSARSTARTLEYSFRFEFDKKMEIAVVTGGEPKGSFRNGKLMLEAKELQQRMDQMQLAN
jgi:uncharacterized protein (TIGR02231 family)